MEAASAVTVESSAAVSASIATQTAVTVESLAGEAVTVFGDSVAEGTVINTSAATAGSASPGCKLILIRVGGAITGAISIAAAGALAGVLAEVSDKMFVDP